MIVRPAAALAAIGAVVVAIAPALPWFSASASAGALTTTGFKAAGALWILPAVGALALVIAAACAATGPALGRIEGRWAGGALVTLGALAGFWALRTILDPPVEVVVTDGSLERPTTLPITVRPAAILAPVAAGLVAAAGVAVARPWSKR